ncbi:hypothetical protein Rhopal_004482-T1 [Rhodotorula paludigena]|uniref:Uncharacterized protein n=1 Tax=Rhodotorula paludigena TaxID=86838 RepID=A0AAV5GQC9_9BASI|nr:hypothetical protein Rhopal_004482-T1 [Rhodotorula paludigena]
MTAPPSFTSSYRDPYDAVDSLPEYPLQEDANESSKSPLMRGDEKKKGEQVPLEVDGFAYELVRLRDEFTTLRNGIARVGALKSQALAFPPEDTSLVAQSILADLAVQTGGTSELLLRLPLELRFFSDKVGFLRPGPGRFLITARETHSLKDTLGVCADELRAVLCDIERGAQAEEEGKQEARVRLLKVIRAQAPPGQADADLMASLLTAEREGTAGVVEQLRPLAYVLPAPTVRPPAYPSFRPLQSAPSTRAYAPLASSGRDSRQTFANEEEGVIGDFGEPLEGPPKTPAVWKRIVGAVSLIVIIILIVIGLILWQKDGTYREGM